MRRLLALLPLIQIVLITASVADAQTPHVIAGNDIELAGEPILARECGEDALAAGQVLLEAVKQTCHTIDRPPRWRPGRLWGHQRLDRQRHRRLRVDPGAGLSVVIPTKNRPVLLRRALDPFPQVDTPLEIIVVDDGSTAANAASNRLACQHLLGCRYVLLSRSKGAAAARNHGFRLSRGAYVWFMDDDDYATPQTVADALQAISTRTGPEILLMPRKTVLGGEVIGLTFPVDEANKFERYRRIGTEVTTSCALFPRSILIRLEGWDETLSALQDTDLLLRAAEIATFASLRTEPVRVDTGAPDRITYAVFASLIGKARFLRKHWHRLPISRRLGYVAQILVCTPLMRAVRRQWRLAAIRRQRVIAGDHGSSL